MLVILERNNPLHELRRRREPFAVFASPAFPFLWYLLSYTLVYSYLDVSVIQCPVLHLCIGDIAILAIH